MKFDRQLRPAKETSWVVKRGRRSSSQCPPHLQVHQNAAVSKFDWAFDVILLAPIKISWWYLKRFKSDQSDKQRHSHTHNKTILITIPPSSAGDTVSPAYNIWSSGLFSSRSDVVELTAQKLVWPVTYCCCFRTITKNISFLRVLVYTVHQRHLRRCAI